MNRIPLAVQLYTVREQCKRDFSGTLRQVAKIGYEYVELAGMHGLSAIELRKLLDDLGLKVISAHMPLDPLEKTIEDSRALGAKMVACGYDPKKLKSVDGCREAGRYLSEIGGKLRAAGIELAYHNHNWEFEKVEGQYALDRLYEAADPQNLKAQLDVYWVKRGGEDPLKYIEQLGSRCLMLHLKDMAPDGDFAEVGSGTLDFPAILKAGEQVGTKALIVEQDTCKRPPLESIRMSFDHLKKLGAA